MTYSKDDNNRNHQLLLKIKICFILLFIGLYSNAQDKPDNIFGYYFSNQEGSLNKTILYHFSKDSLLVYNAGISQYLKFSANYQPNGIALSNIQVKDHELKIASQNDSIINLFDSENILSKDKKNKLVKFEVAENIDIVDLIDVYWTFYRDDEPFLYWFFHPVENRIDEYVVEDDLNINCHPLISGKFFSKFNGLYFVDSLFSGELIVTTKLENDTLTFKGILPNGKVKRINFLKYKEQENEVNINGKWEKINSKNSFDLPEELVITDRIINISDTLLNYRLGLDKRFIIYRKDRSRSIKIEKITDNQLNLKIRSNTTHSEEIGIYEKK